MATRPQGLGQIVMAVGEPGIQRDGLAKGHNGLVEPPHARQADAQRIEIQRTGAGRGDGLADVFDRLVRPPALETRHGEEVQGVGTIGRLVEHRPALLLATPATSPDSM